MEPASSQESFLADPVGRYVVGARYLAWCHDPTLAGSCHWGRLTRDDLAELERFLLWRPLEVGLHSRFDMISDCARVEGIEPDAYALVAAKWGEHLPNLATMVGRLAFVHGGGFLGEVMTGVFSLTGTDFWRAFESAGEAFAWLGRDALAEEVGELVDRQSGISTTLDSVRRLLRARQGDITLEEAARTLARSPRSLQRDLRSSGSSFREELQLARLEAARAMVIETDLDFKAIALKVGCSSQSQLSRLFRRLAGEAPTELRARHRNR